MDYLSVLESQVKMNPTIFSEVNSSVVYLKQIKQLLKIGEGIYEITSKVQIYYLCYTLLRKANQSSNKT